jgi:hypoxanthine phosphoribosyltransferase
MEKVFGRPLITQEQMRNRVKELGRQITADFQEEKDLLMVGILKGAFAFYADLCRAIRLPITVDFLVVTSYRSRSTTSGKVKIVTDLTEEVKGRTVLIVEDIVDSGLTLESLIKTFSKKKPKQIVTCALLSKPERRQVKVPVDYVGFEIPDTFVVGYGLDYQQKYRNLPYLASLERDVDSDKQ